MNFVVGFLLLVSGGKEADAFWVFAALTNKMFSDQPSFDGLEGFYMEGFPLLLAFCSAFDIIFEERLPALKQLFD